VTELAEPIVNVDDMLDMANHDLEDFRAHPYFTFDVKNLPEMVKTVLTNPTIETTLKQTIVKTIIIIIRDWVQNYGDGKVKTTLTILSNKTGSLIFQYLDTHGAATITELERELDIPKGHLTYWIRILERAELVKKIVFRYKPRHAEGSGPIPKVYLIDGAEPSRAGAALDRHYNNRRRPHVEKFEATREPGVSKDTMLKEIEARAAERALAYQAERLKTIGTNMSQGDTEEAA